jgi:hypothetical protein
MNLQRRVATILMRRTSFNDFNNCNNFNNSIIHSVVTITNILNVLKDYCYIITFILYPVIFGSTHIHAYFINKWLRSQSQ